MYQIRSRQLARLEKLARPYLKHRIGIEERWLKIRRGAVSHATILAFLIRHGKPEEGEPLSNACQRVTESQAWKDCLDNIIPRRTRYVPFEQPFAPYDRATVLYLGEPLRHAVISSFPGSNEKAKLNAIFKSAPPWLIWFTFADYTAAVLDLELPSLSSVRGFARSREAFDRWWGLPDGTFECRPWPKDCESELARADLSLLRPEPLHDQSMTRRQRKRALAASVNWTDEWPVPYPLAFFHMDIRSVLAQAGAPGFVTDKRHPEFCGEMSRQARWRGSVTFFARDSTST
jgi:hypothetical protein